jgi:hypothetical protein
MSATKILLIRLKGGMPSRTGVFNHWYCQNKLGRRDGHEKESCVAIGNVSHGDRTGCDFLRSGSYDNTTHHSTTDNGATDNGTTHNIT